MASRRSTRRAASRPMRASSGVSGRPIAVAVCQKAAVEGAISCAPVAAPSTISVVSDGEDMSRPVSAATPRRLPGDAQQHARHHRLHQHHAGHREHQLVPVGQDLARIDAPCRRSAGTRRGRRPLNGSMITSTCWAIFRLGDQHAGQSARQTMGESPAAVVAMEERITISRLAARNNSGLLVRAALREQRRQRQNSRWRAAPGSSPCR